MTARTALDALRLRRSHPRALLLTRAALLVLMAAVLVLAGGHLVHVHAAHTAGLYNEQHVFEGTAGLSADAPIPSGPAAQALFAVVAAAPPATPAVVPAPAPRRADSRAPPSA